MSFGRLQGEYCGWRVEASKRARRNWRAKSSVPQNWPWEASPRRGTSSNSPRITPSIPIADGSAIVEPNKQQQFPITDHLKRYEEDRRVPRTLRRRVNKIRQIYRTTMIAGVIRPLPHLHLSHLEIQRNKQRNPTTTTAMDRSSKPHALGLLIYLSVQSKL